MPPSLPIRRVLFLAVLAVGGCRTGAAPGLAEEAPTPAVELPSLPLAALYAFAAQRGYARSTGHVGPDGTDAHALHADMDQDGEPDAVAFVVSRDSIAIAACRSRYGGYDCLLDAAVPFSERAALSEGRSAEYRYEWCSLGVGPDPDDWGRSRALFSMFCGMSGKILEVKEGGIEVAGTIN